MIYLGDNGLDKLSYYFECMTLEGNTYEDIKAAMNEEMGKPVLDFSMLDYENLDYQNINEYFLDDFKDLKS